MKGQTNAVLTLLTGDILNLKLVTNLSSHEDLVGATITIDYGIVKTFTWEGKDITVQIPQFLNYTITVSDIEGYATPNAQTFTAKINNVNNLVMLYNTELVTASDITGYITPAEQSFTASLPLRNINLVYEELLLGVYIYGTDGKLYDVDSWEGDSNATGVAVITDTVRLIVAPDEWHTYKGSDDGAWNGNKQSAWGGYNKTVSNIVTTTDFSTAITDFAGSSNTDQIITQLSGTTDEYSSNYTGAPAAEYCRAYSSGCKGIGEWYLPAAGELNVLATNKDAINKALTKISGETLDFRMEDSYTWTSTQFDSRNAYLYWWDGEFVFLNKAIDGGVRPVCAF